MDAMTTDTPYTSTAMETTENMTTMSMIITTAQNCPSSGIPFYWGFITAIIAIFFYGTNFAPVKKFDTGDGMFFQWVVCAAIFVVGLVVQIIRSSPKFFPIVMLGGAIWETGNVCVVPIIKTIGLGLGLCVWGMTNLLSGWATGRFGLFGTKEDIPDNVTMNYIGVALAVSSAVIFSMVKNDVSEEGMDQTVTVDIDEQSPLLGQEYPRGNSDSLYTTNNSSHDAVVFSRRRNSSINTSSRNEDEDLTFFDRLPPGSKRIFGFGLSVVSGLLYGQMFTPAFNVMNSSPDNSQNALDYVFSTFCGIFLSSTFYFMVYAAFMKNRPKVYPRAILPGVVSGLMWGVATSCWFVANKVLSEAVAFPIVTTGPAVVASLLGVFIFKEIKGRRNILILLLGFAVTGTGAVLAGLSKKESKSSC